jgi:hypothetical protein
MNSLPRALSSLLVFAATLASAPVLRADPIRVIDQQHLTTRIGGLGVVGSTDVFLAQTFTVGLTGTLTQIDLNVFFPHEDFSRFTDPLSIQLRTTVGGTPTNTVVDAIAVAPQNLPTDRFALTAFSGFGVNVTAGDALAIVLTTGPNGNFGWGLGACCYGGGAAHWTPNGGAFVPISFPEAPEFLFRTWVEADVTPTPEPGTMLLAATGVAAVVARRRRKR